MLEIYFSGVCGPHNSGGHIGYASYIIENGIQKFSTSKYIKADPSHTVNVAEYMALQAALEHLVELSRTGSPVTVKSTNLLVVKQMPGKWIINAGYYAPYARHCRRLASKINNIKYELIPATSNAKAEDMAKMELINHSVRVSEKRY